MKILYDPEIEVTREQYIFLMNAYKQRIVVRTEGGGIFFIKVWDMRAARQIRKFLTNTK